MNRFIYRQPVMRKAGLWLYALLSLCENDFAFFAPLHKNAVMQNPIIPPGSDRLLDLAERIANALKSIRDRLERPWDSQYPIRGKGKPGEPINKRGTPRL